METRETQQGSIIPIEAKGPINPPASPEEIGHAIAFAPANEEKFGSYSGVKVVFDATAGRMVETRGPRIKF